MFRLRDTTTFLTIVKRYYTMNLNPEEYDISGGKEDTKNRMREFLSTGCVEDLGPLDIEPEDSHDWDEPYETDFSIPDGNVKYTVTKASISTDDWITFQKYAHNSDSDESFRVGSTQRTIDRVKEDVQNGTTEDIPTPVLEISYDGTISYDEGRSRGLGAKEAGLDRIPIWIVVRDYY